jgi:hypothetical protein
MGLAPITFRLRGGYSNIELQTRNGATTENRTPHARLPSETRQLAGGEIVSHPVRFRGKIQTRPVIPQNKRWQRGLPAVAIRVLPDLLDYSRYSQCGTLISGRMESGPWDWYRTNILRGFKPTLIYFSYPRSKVVASTGIAPVFSD